MLNSKGHLTQSSIICLANAEWDWTARLNCHHIMQRLAAENQILFVDTVGARVPSPRRKQDVFKVWKRLSKTLQSPREVLPNLVVISPLILPFHHSSAVKWINKHLLWIQIRFILNKLSFRPRILWTFAPLMVSLVDSLQHDLLIYQCVDEHSANPGVDSAGILEAEKQILSKADIVVTTSRKLLENKKIYNNKTIYLPNVADVSLFQHAMDSDLAIPEEVLHIPPPVAGFIGNITAYKVNLSMISSVARKNKDWSFLLIGPWGGGDPSTDLSELQTIPNVFLIGPRPYEHLPAYIKKFDVCILPMNNNQSMSYSFPMKFFEYMASGKPIVGTAIPALDEFREYYRVANDEESFSKNLKQSLIEDNSPGKIQARIDISNQFSWEKQIKSLSMIIETELLCLSQK
jgi:glycosyltransferase involved in cell wall biosynthesis